MFIFIFIYLCLSYFKFNVLILSTPFNDLFCSFHLSILYIHVILRSNILHVLISVISCIYLIYLFHLFISLFSFIFVLVGW